MGSSIDIETLKQVNEIILRDKFYSKEIYLRK